eukprot:GHVQ01025711.1.p2 GENE.GHVQ01025711.1~~GHVQ01025711.1.p2  ORF type:complete len:125 (+),score=32.88 GHVQ01025711.1:1048-1422(+)
MQKQTNSNYQIVCIDTPQTYTHQHTHTSTTSLYVYIHDTCTHTPTPTWQQQSCKDVHCPVDTSTHTHHQVPHTAAYTHIHEVPTTMYVCYDVRQYTTICLLVLFYACFSEEMQKKTVCVNCVCV